MRIAAKLFLIAVLSVTFVRGASAYEFPALPIPSAATGVELTLPGMGEPGASALETAFLGGGSFDISFGDDDEDDDDFGLDISLGDDDDDEDDEDDDEDDDDEDDGLDY